MTSGTFHTRFPPLPTPTTIQLQPMISVQPRPIKRALKAGIFTEGAGFKVKRPFPTRDLSHMDPFLMLDHLGPKLYAPNEFKGAPNHPHRGQITLTYILDGELRHTDSKGHSGVLGPGWSQWMTAGAGVIHDERPTPAFSKTGGVVEGFQIWINLRRHLKMSPPRYQDYHVDKIPRAIIQSCPGTDGKIPSPRSWVNIIAGEAFGIKSIVKTESPTHVLHFIVEPGAEAYWTIPQEFKNNFQCGVYIIRGTGTFGSNLVIQNNRVDAHDQQDKLLGQTIDEGTFLMFERQHNNHADMSSAITFRNASDAAENLSFLLLAGEPFDEPIARHGPFVMNTPEEIEQAFDDFHAGRFGQIPPEILQ